MEDLFFGAVVSEINVRELHRSHLAGLTLGLLTPMNLRASVEDFVDTTGGDVGARQHHKEHSEEEEGHHDLDGVLHKGHHIAKVGEVSGDERDPNIDTEQGGAVKDQADQRVLDRQNYVYDDIQAGKIAVGFLKLALFQSFVIEGADDTETGEILAGEHGDAVKQLLEHLELRHHNRHHQNRKEEDGANGESDNPGHTGRGDDGLDDGNHAGHWGAQSHG